MTQSELAAGRFSKEYISQIERGAARPTGETLTWLAGRLATDSEYLTYGLGLEDQGRVDRLLDEAERLLDARRYSDATASFAAARALIGTDGPPALSFRCAKGEAWARLRDGDTESAMAALDVAADLSVGVGFGDLDRAEVVYLVGVVRYTEARISDALVLLDEALELAETSSMPSDWLRSDILHWRSRCHRRNRDWVAAAEDGERALELAEACADSRRIADALFQASLVAQRQGRWALSRTFAERSKTLFADLGDRATVARLLNNLAGLEHLLGDADRALELLEEALVIFTELDLTVDAGYVCSSVAAIRLESGDALTAEADARKALDLLDGRSDHGEEIGAAQVTLGRALVAQGRLDEGEAWILEADGTFERARSVSYRSGAWVAEGDVQSKRGNDARAAELYRQAALALMDPDPDRIVP